MILSSPGALRFPNWATILAIEAGVKFTFLEIPPESQASVVRKLSMATERGECKLKAVLWISIKFFARASAFSVPEQTVPLPVASGGRSLDWLEEDVARNVDQKVGSVRLNEARVKFHFICLRVEILRLIALVTSRMCSA